METVTDDDVSKLSKIEQRKLKLAEYLAAKGRLKVSNPKPYLKEKPVTKKYAEKNQTFKITGDGKENCGINGENIQVKRVKTLAEVDKNTSSKKGLSINSLAKAQTQSSSKLQNACREGINVLKTQSNRTASLQNPRKPYKDEKTSRSFNDAKRTNSQSVQNAQPKAQPASHAANKAQRSRNHNCGNSQSGRGIAAQSRTDQIHAKTDIQSMRPLAKKLTETYIKTTSVSTLKSRRTMNTTETKMQTNSVSKTQLQFSRNCSSQSNKPVNQKSNSVINRSDVKQRKDIPSIVSKVGAIKMKSNSSVTNRVTRTNASSSEPANREGSVIIKNKQSAAVKQTNLTAPTKALGRSTKSCVESRELHQPTQGSRQAKPAVQLQTPKSRFCPNTHGVRTAPVDGMKKPTAAQEKRLRKLQEWRESRGITYKRPPMPVHLVRRKTVSAIPQPYWTSMENEDEVHDIVFAVDRSLDDCIKLLQQGFPVEQVRDVLSRVPMAQKFAKYWICQARLMEREGNLEVLPMFQEAIRVVREPVDELRSVVFEILKKRQIQGLSPMPKESDAVETRVHDELEDSYIMCTPKPVGAVICGRRGDSSVVKYKITATPGGKRSQQGAEPGQVEGHEIRFFTPVRRSVRIEKTALRYPTALQEHDPCVTSLCDLAGESKVEVKEESRAQSSPVYVYRENEALRDHVHIKLVYPEEDET
ncbi:cytoskeleton-associated protein 2-like [Carassius carassius]|uniref:cytoskeleton-associated protein 2-like n=1 Tax=Carassius carassius TaxID=217509 RepID=UPI0028696D6F|nr:cytoskeleton-associated protein 2-like [Carassius carassius]